MIRKLGEMNILVFSTVVISLKLFLIGVIRYGGSEVYLSFNNLLCFFSNLSILQNFASLSRLCVKLNGLFRVHLVLDNIGHLL